MAFSASDLTTINAIQQGFVNGKAGCASLMASAKASGDAKGYVAANAARVALEVAHVAVADLLMGYDAAQAGIIIINGPGR